MAVPALPPHVPQPIPVEPEVQVGSDLARLLAVTGFALRAARRRPVLTAAVFLVTWLTTLAAAKWMPRAYTVSTKVFVQNNKSILFLSNPHRAAAAESEVTTPKGIAESVLRRDTIVAVVDETGAAARWEVWRPPALKLLDRVRRAVSATPAEPVNAGALARMLENQIEVRTDDSSITISLDWHDPEGAYDIVAAVQRHFLEDRCTSETAAATETIAILEEESARQRETLNA